MNFLYPLIFLVFFTLSTTNFTYSNRIKRRVVFNKNSKFFIRLNGKTSVLNSTGIFAHGWALRINYDLPDTIPKINKFFKRSVEPPEEENEFASLASSCLSKHICRMFSNTITNSTCGVFCEMKKIIYSSKGPQADYFKSFLENCSSYDEECPMNLERIVDGGM